MSASRSPASSATISTLAATASAVIRGERIWAEDARIERAVDTDDVRFTCCDAEHTRAAAADQDRWARRLDGLGSAVIVRDTVVLTLERERPRPHRTPDDGETLDEPVDKRTPARS